METSTILLIASATPMVIAIISAFATKSNREKPLTHFLMKGLIATWFIGFILLYFAWYGKYRSG